MNAYSETLKREMAKRRAKRNSEIRESLYEKKPVKEYPICVEVETPDIRPALIPLEYEISNFVSFRNPKTGVRTFLFSDKTSFESFLKFLRTQRASFTATLLPPPQRPNNVLRGF